MIKKWIKKLFNLEDRMLIHKTVLTKSEDERVNRFILHCLIDDLNKMNTTCEYALRNIDIDKIGQSATVVAEARVVSRMIFIINKYEKEYQQRIDGKINGKDDGFIEEN